MSTTVTAPARQDFTVNRGMSATLRFGPLKNKAGALVDPTGWSVAVRFYLQQGDDSTAAVLSKTGTATVTVANCVDESLIPADTLSTLTAGPYWYGAARVDPGAEAVFTEGLLTIDGTQAR